MVRLRNIRFGLMAVGALAIFAGGAGATGVAEQSRPLSNPDSLGIASLPKGAPILIGADLSLSGDFATEGLPYQQGYRLWASVVNAHGGLMGHQVKLTILSDASNQAQVTTNYEKLINVDHVNLLFGPVSSLFTVPAAREALRFGDALVEGAGGGPVVFNSGLTNVFDTGQPIADQVVPFAKYIAAMPKSLRPKTVAYATQNDPFSVPAVQGAQAILAKAGLRTVFNKVFPQEVADYAPVADQLAASKADVVILGVGDLSQLSPFMHAFIQQGYDPKALYAGGGASPPQFLPAIGGAGVGDGVATTGNWWPGFANAESQTFVKAELKANGGTAANIDPSVPEAYSVGQVVEQAVEATHSVDNKTIINYLHSGARMQTVLGPVAFNGRGENTVATAFIFQWQKGQYVAVIPRQPSGPPMQYPKPAWATS